MLGVSLLTLCKVTRADDLIEPISIDIFGFVMIEPSMR